jgi:hypothetical protein
MSERREFLHPETTASRPPACACGLPALRLLPTGSPGTFRAACCFAEYLLTPPVAGGTLPVLSLVKEGPEPFGVGTCDACGQASLYLYALDSAPVAGACLCRACLEAPEKAAI